MKILIPSMAAICTLLGNLGAQQPSPAVAVGKTESSVRVRETVTQFKGPVNGHATCDSSGNIYARPVMFGESGEKMARAPLYQLHSNGTAGTTFRISDASPDLILPPSGFFVTSSGDVYMVGWSSERAHQGSRVYVVSFAKNGSLRASTQMRVPEDFVPQLIAVFSKGEILLSGWAGSSGHRPVTAVFRASGELVTSIHPPEDDDLARQADAEDPRVTLKGSNYGNLAVLGGAVTASDGNVYLMRKTLPPIIYVINPNGAIVRTLRIASPDSTLAPSNLQTHGRELAITFSDPDARSDSRMVEIAGLDGKVSKMHQLSGNGTSRGPLACYAQGSLQFLITEDSESGATKLNTVETEP